ncbi:hypothetical protein TNCT_102651 [Trichonephila clavata]|uniref:Endonuclease/exonuclease/phosphatase domain-containing protein n=1 Tax=Trichonephila clavata TaxID=2740835 RepID=A0A8X6KS31_TRICU|nr:hypothetical protein TNCT_102651 [Trichonephila clavata]
MTNTKSKKDTETETDIGTQTEISNIETPTNTDNLTSESHKDFPIAQTPITNNLIEQETTPSPPQTSFTDLESLNLDKRSPETLHLSVPSDTEVLMEIDKISTKRPATGNVQEAAKIPKPSIRIESGGIQTTKKVEDVMLLDLTWSVLGNPLGSDHFPVVISYATPIACATLRQPRWKFDQADWETFRTQADITEDMVSSGSIDEAVSLVTSCILSAANNAISQPSSRLPVSPNLGGTKNAKWQKG